MASLPRPAVQLATSCRSNRASSEKGRRQNSRSISNPKCERDATISRLSIPAKWEDTTNRFCRSDCRVFLGAPLGALVGAAMAAVGGLIIVVLRHVWDY